MIDITAWMKNFLQTLSENFADRVWFVGKHQEELLTIATLNEQAIINTFLGLKKWWYSRFHSNVRNIVCLGKTVDC